MENQNSSVRSVDRALDILDCFMSDSELSLLEIAKHTDLSPSTVHRIIGVLMERHYLERREDDKKFLLGSRIRQLFDKDGGNLHADLKRVSLAPMSRLREMYNENVILYVQDDVYKLCIAICESTRPVREIVSVGEHHLLTKGAAGRILLAYMDRKTRDRLFKDTQFDESRLEAARRKGYTLSRGEREEGLVGIAVPIYNFDGTVIAALSLSGPESRFAQEEMTDKILALVDTGREISRELGYNGK